MFSQIMYLPRIGQVKANNVGLVITAEYRIVMAVTVGDRQY